MVMVSSGEIREYVSGLNEREQYVFYKTYLLECERIKADNPLKYTELLGWQEELMRDVRPVQIINGTNRSGKTVYAAIYICSVLEGRHPLQREVNADGNLEIPLPPHCGGLEPLDIRAIAYDVSNGINDVMLPLIKKYIRKDLLLYPGNFDKSFLKEHRTLRMGDGSQIHFMTNNQDIRTFHGVKPHIIWFDEEPEIEVYEANVTRTIDRNGRLLITATIEPGVYSWLSEAIDTYMADEEMSSFVCIRNVTIRDNSFLNQRYVDQRSKLLLSEESRKIKLEGEWQGMNMVFWAYRDVDPWVIPDFEIPEDWSLFLSMDYHTTKPIAIQFWAVDPDENYYIYREARVNSSDLIETVKVIHDLKGGREFVKEITDRRGTNVKNRVSNKKTPYELMRDEGGWLDLQLSKCNNTKDLTSKMAGARLLNDYFSKNSETGVPKLRIFESCEYTRREIKKTYKRRDRYSKKFIDDFDDSQLDFVSCARMMALEKPWFELKSKNRSKTVSNIIRLVDMKNNKSHMTAGY